MYYPKFTVTTTRGTFEVTAVNKFRAEAAAKAQLQPGEEIECISRKHPK